MQWYWENKLVWGKEKFILHSLNFKCQWDIKLKGPRSIHKVIKAQNFTYRTTLIMWCSFFPRTIFLKDNLIWIWNQSRSRQIKTKLFFDIIDRRLCLKISDQDFVNTSPLIQIHSPSSLHSWTTEDFPQAAESSQGAWILHSGQGRVERQLKCRPGSFSRTLQSCMSFPFLERHEGWRQRPGVLLKYFQIEIWGQGSETYPLTVMLLRLLISILFVLKEAVDFGMHSVPFWEELDHLKVVSHITENSFPISFVSCSLYCIHKE